MAKKFAFLISKQGSSEELFRKFDRNNNGYVVFNEFKDVCSKMHLGFKEEELENIFKMFCSPEELGHARFKKRPEDKSQSTEQPTRAFNFRKFISVISFFRNKDHLNTILYKLDQALKEKNITYKQVLQNFQAVSKTSVGKQKKLQSARNKQQHQTNQVGGSNKAQPGEIHISELKLILKGLELGLSHDDLNALVDAYQTEIVTYQLMEQIGKATVAKVEKASDEKSNIFIKIVNQLQEALLREHVSLQRIFFEYDERQDGCLLLDELHKMLTF